MNLTRHGQHEHKGVGMAVKGHGYGQLKRKLGLTRAWRGGPFQWLLALCVAFAFASLACAMPPSQPGQGGQDVTPHLTLLVDADAKLSLTEVQQADAQGRFVATTGNTVSLAFGFSRAAYWLRLELENPQAQAVSQRLDLQNSRISSATLYSPTPTGSYQPIVTGSDLPFATRAQP